MDSVTTTLQITFAVWCLSMICFRIGMANHELNCIFRTVPCPLAICQKEIAFRNIDIHIRDKHNNAANTLTKPQITPFLKKSILDNRHDNWVLFTFQENEVHFYPIFVKRNDHWYFWVIIKDNPEAASAWVFTAKTKSEDNKFEVRARGLVHPVDMTVNEIIETGQYLLMNRKCVEKLTYQNGNSRSNRIGITFTMNKK